MKLTNYQGLQLGLAVVLAAAGGFALEKLPLESAIMTSFGGGLYMICMVIRTFAPFKGM